MTDPKVVGTQRDPVRRAARSVALTVGAASLVLVVLVTVGAILLFDREQSAETRARVQASALAADDTADAPPGIWLIEIGTKGRAATPGTPDFILDAPELVTPRSTTTRVKTSSGAYPVAVSEHSGSTFVAVYDIALHREEESRLIRSALLAGGFGILLAGGVGLIAGRRAVRPLATALELQRQFVADASHELRTPLAVVSTRAQMVQRHLSAEANPAHRREVDQLVDDTRAMGEVVSDLLLSAQLEHAPIAAESVDLTALAAEVVQSLEAYAVSQSVTLSSQLPGDAVRVLGVRTSLRRALVALIDNAIAHSPQLGEVLVRVENSVDGPRLAIIDHGQGVGAEDLTRITQRFARSRPGEGGRRVGLGLALVTQIVRSHGGRLLVDETPGGGATFIIALPAEA
ncbi:cell wall metabolism sensor histidine kinase WalK [Janibacter sp. HTCC2649]|uniref:sensor histidine kinase n=1 Tax=Janibacter sp. HTCC2649 TaxID=313589 RepID=UPI000A0744E0|nr:HAMP domain-containing sensor histidine kinase [Janibacter sp. HTCC2649]